MAEGSCLSHRAQGGGLVAEALFPPDLSAAPPACRAFGEKSPRTSQGATVSEICVLRATYTLEGEAWVGGYLPGSGCRSPGCI